MKLIIDGLDAPGITHAMRDGIHAACEAAPTLNAVDAGNYGGKLGPHHFHLHKVLNP